MTNGRRECSGQRTPGRVVLWCLVPVLLALGCGVPEESGPDLEQQRLALSVCQTAEDCPAPGSCRTARCLSGECRYILQSIGCCSADQDCPAPDVCAGTRCDKPTDATQGQCVSFADPDRPDCCLDAATCPLPSPGFVAVCADDMQAGYPRCQEVSDPEGCTPPFSGVVINEFMPYAAAVSDTVGEWIELYNTGSAAVDLRGWAVGDSAADYFVIESGTPLVIPAGGYFVLGRSDNMASNGGYQPDFVYFNMILSNGQDEIILYDAGGQEVDRVEYGGTGFEVERGSSFSLLNPFLNNSIAANWTRSKRTTSPFVDRGTPGGANADAFYRYFTSPVCHDGNQCTLDLCGGEVPGRCLHVPIRQCCQYDVECNDGDRCTQDVCAPATLTCSSTLLPNCCTRDSQCNDGNHCTLDGCVNGRCRHARDPVKPDCCTADAQCKDINPCTIDYCSQVVGQPYKTCHHLSPVGVKCCMTDLDCDDGLVATLNRCENNQCKSQPNPEYCVGPPPQYCNDGDPCTTDSCDFAKSLCRHDPVLGCCKANSQCDDGDVCTDGICQLAVNKCVHIARSGCCHKASDCQAFMTDLDMCKQPFCVANQCRLRPAPSATCCLTNADCDDGDPCTNDLCNPGAHTCSHTSLGKSCCRTNADCEEDDDPCTDAACVAHRCIFRHASECCKGDWECEDGSPCSIDRCIGYRCRYITSPEFGCCHTAQDCPASPSACIQVSCSGSGQCVYASKQSCTVTPDWLERYSGAEQPEFLGWSGEVLPGMGFGLEPGTDWMGSDPSLVLRWTQSAGPGGMCTWSPAIGSLSPQELLSMTFEQYATSSAPASVRLVVKGRPSGLTDTLKLGQMEVSQAGPRPASLSIPYKLRAAPFQLGFCIEVIQPGTEGRWEIDNIRVGRGAPPRFLDLWADFYREPQNTVSFPLTAVDPDGGLLVASVQGPGHMSISGVSWSAQGTLSSSLVFWPTSRGDVGSFHVVAEVSDGFFEDRQMISEHVYNPKCLTHADCDDLNDCSVDTCVPWEGCSHHFLPGCCNELTWCDDEDECTGEVCVNGQCTFPAVDCNDGNLCTQDDCNPMSGCVYTFNTLPCDDGNACTVNTTCHEGSCHGPPISCDDGLDCTQDGCDPGFGCWHQNLCDDSILCTVDVCTPAGCRYGKTPVGTPDLDGVEDTQWPASSLVAEGTPPLSRLRFLLDSQNMYIGVKCTPQGGSAVVLAVDVDFPGTTGVSSMSQINTQGTGLGSLLASQLSVSFPGFGADLVVIARFPSGAAGMPDVATCYRVSPTQPPQGVPCTVVWTPNGFLEVALSWAWLYPQTDFTGDVSAVVAGVVSSSGLVLKTLPGATGSTVTDVRVFGVADPVCLSAFCGDGYLDAGEECDMGEGNSNVLPDVCRENCRNPWCGDGVVDFGETCDTGAQNSDVLPNRCRGNCLPARCGDGVVDTGETCDNGLLNSNTVADRCRTNCLPARCGDGTVDSQEECDWGMDNANLPGACRTNCKSPFCGDGIVDPGEECDQGALNAPSTPDVCRTSCKSPYCGDGIVDVLRGEHCDHGPLNSDVVPNACRKSCLPARCGDGVVDTGEECDDGNSENWDGCKNNCQVYVPSCGDGVVNAGEECDWGAMNSNTLPDRCRADCRDPRCGDGVVDTGELCDDGNLLRGDLCDWDCTPYVAVCGNGWKDPGEECDSGQLNSDLVPDRCRTNCTLPKCGDGVKDTAEECDNGVFNSNQVANACRTNCRNPWCGDSVVDTGEQCDQGAANANLPDRCKPNCVAPRCGDGLVDQTLQEQCDLGSGNSATTPNTCRLDCKIPWCGDGVKDQGEECDSGNLNSDTLADRCRTTCKLPRCGDGIKDSGEGCDDGPLNVNGIPDRCHVGCIAPRCGDGLVDVLHGEQCDNGSFNSDVFPNHCRTTCKAAGCGDGVKDSGEECDDGNRQNGDGCDSECMEEVYIPFPGDIIITEIMQNPAVTQDAFGEYFEVYNTRNYPIDINRWVISSAGDPNHIIDHPGPLFVPPSGYLVLGINGSQGVNGGIPVNYVYSGILLLNGADTLQLSYKGSVSDIVAYDGGPSFPSPSGPSMNLDPDHFHHLSNDSGVNWCLSTTPLPSGDMGTPGQPNVQCP